MGLLTPLLVERENWGFYPIKTVRKSRIFSVPRVLTNEGEWVVAGGGRKPSGAGEECFQTGLEWRRELFKPFLEREGHGLILVFNIECFPPLSSSLLQPWNKFSPYTKWTLFPTIYPINETNMSNFYGKIVQKANGHICTKKVDIFGVENWNLCRNQEPPLKRILFKRKNANSLPVEKFLFSGKCVIRLSFISIAHLTIWKKQGRMIADPILPCIQNALRPENRNKRLPD